MIPLHAFLISVSAELLAAEKFSLKYKIDTNLEGPSSQYTKSLIQLARLESVESQKLASISGKVALECYGTKDEKYFVGAKQYFEIKAPVEKVRSVLDDFAHYKDIFLGLKDVHVVSQDGNRVTTFWEQKIPVFFIPNVKYEMNYLIDHSRSEGSIYRYQLKQSKNIRTSDGLIVIHQKAGNPQETVYLEYDFVDADWGALETFAPSRIWGDTIEGLYASDLAVQYRAEHPDWDFDKVRDESEDHVDKEIVKTCIDNKVAFEIGKNQKNRGKN